VAVFPRASFFLSLRLVDAWQHSLCFETRKTEPEQEMTVVDLLEECLGEIDQIRAHLGAILKDERGVQLAKPKETECVSVEEILRSFAEKVSSWRKMKVKTPNPLEFAKFLEKTFISRVSGDSAGKKGKVAFIAMKREVQKITKMSSHQKPKNSFEQLMAQNEKLFEQKLQVART